MLRFFLSTVCFFYITLSSAQLHPEFISYLEEEMQRIATEVGPIGLSVAVKSGNDTWNSQVGISGEGDDLDQESLLAMGSITKTFISACVLSLMEEDKLNLSDPIGMYIDNFENVDSTISIKQLLNHTSGVFNYTNHMGFFDEVFSPDFQRHSYTPEEILNKFVDGISFSKGARQEYSNTNYLILGMIIEKITGRPYYEEIFDRYKSEQNYPSLGVPPFTHDSYDLSNLWADVGNGFLEDVESYNIGLDGLFSSAGSAGAFTCNPSDLAAWGYDLYSGKLHKESSVDSLFTPPPFQFAPGIIYGLGVVRTESGCGGITSGHGGGIIYTADLQYAHDFDLSVVVMTNDGTGIPALGGVGGIATEIVCNFGATLTSSEEIFQADQNVSVYPNPVEDEFFVTVVNGAERILPFQLVDQNGRLIKEGIIEDAETKIAALRNASKGVYILKMNLGKNIVTKKLIKL